MKPRDQLPSLFTPEFYRNPYPAYAALRRSDPVHWDEEHQVWLLTRYADVAAALAEPRLARGAGDLKVEAEDPLRLGVQGRVDEHLVGGGLEPSTSWM